MLGRWKGEGQDPRSQLRRRGDRRGVRERRRQGERRQRRVARTVRSEARRTRCAWHGVRTHRYPVGLPCEHAEFVRVLQHCALGPRRNPCRCYASHGGGGVGRRPRAGHARSARAFHLYDLGWRLVHTHRTLLQKHRPLRGDASRCARADCPRLAARLRGDRAHRPPRDHPLGRASGTGAATRRQRSALEAPALPDGAQGLQIRAREYCMRSPTISRRAVSWASNLPERYSQPESYLARASPARASISIDIFLKNSSSIFDAV
mmetsp:Transcript_19465/g.49469  ORF Transcript_19465/g.49469 Transcript_19465/m.49469 type:complete len:263 (-) Transcript_19465:81-869(-)